MARIVIIGAGMGGLAAAARLAALGHRVTVCEAAPTHGGMVGRYERDGFAFDTGPGLLTLPAVYRDLFLKTGRDRLEDNVGLFPVEPESRHLLPDGTELTLPNASRAGVVRALDAAFGAGAGEAWGAVMDRGRRVWEATRRPLLEEPLPEGTGPLHQDPYPAAARRGLARVLPGARRRVLADVARRELAGRPGPAALLEEYALRHGFDPREAPASLTVVPYMEQTFGVWYVAGGIRALADAVLDRCRARGVDLRFGARVLRITADGGRAAGVELADGSRPVADTVVCTADAYAATAGGLLPPDAVAPGGGAAHRPPAPGRFTVLLALRGARPPGTAHRTVVHAADRADELAALFGPGARRPCDRPTVEVLRPDDPALRPDSVHEPVTLRVTVPPHGTGPDAVDWTADLAEHYADRVIDAVEAAGIPLRDRVLWRHVRTPADTGRAVGSPGGSVPGPALAGAGGAFLRPDNRSRMPGLYLAGGSVHPGGGLPRAGMSAAVTAGLIGPP